MLKVEIDEYLEEEIFKKMAKKGISKEQLEVINRDDIFKYIDGNTICHFLINGLKRKLKKITKKDISEDSFDNFFQNIKNKNTIIVFGTYDPYENANDGYTNRIKDIDDNLINDFYRVYIEFEDIKDNYGIYKIDNMHTSIIMNSYNDKHLSYLNTLINKDKLLLIHGLHRVMIDRVNPKMVEMIENENIKVIFDVHGAVPEEIELNDTSRRVHLANQMEKYLIDNSDYIISISNSMIDHFNRKYQIDDKKYRIIPVKTNNQNDIDLEKKKYIKKCIYSGGVQAWQNIDLMAEIVKNTHENIFYDICLAGDIENIKHKFEMSNVEVGYRKSDEIKNIYKEANFGLALRDDSPVNRVASPTKITEYILNGIVPVLKFDEIGDLKKMGLKYINYQDFNSLKLPNEIEYLEIINNNFNIIKEIENRRNEALSVFKEELNNYFKKRVNNG